MSRPAVKYRPLAVITMHRRSSRSARAVAACQNTSVTCGLMALSLSWRSMVTVMIPSSSAIVACAGSVTGPPRAARPRGPAMSCRAKLPCRWQSHDHPASSQTNHRIPLDDYSVSNTLSPVAPRSRSNPLALAVLACLYERPMHPYEVAQTLRSRAKHESIRLNYGSLYSVVEALEAKGLIEPAGDGPRGPPPRAHDLRDHRRRRAWS